MDTKEKLHFLRAFTRSDYMRKEKMLSDKTADRIYDMIKEKGAFAPGDKLPNEIELSKILGVSRTTLREAVKILVTAGILEIKRGKGTFVSENAENVDKTNLDTIDAFKISAMDIFEIRLIIEPEAAFLAAQRATDEELKDILKKGMAVEKKLIKNQDRTEEEYMFHKSIADAAHNQFMSELLPIIFNAIDTGVKISKEIKEITTNTLYDHRTIMSFMENRDAEGAKTAMKLHIMHAMNSMRK